MDCTRVISSSLLLLSVAGTWHSGVINSRAAAAVGGGGVVVFCKLPHAPAFPTLKLIFLGAEAQEEEEDHLSEGEEERLLRVTRVDLQPQWQSSGFPAPEQQQK